jgi:pantoate--beta-alanine ligase
MEVVSVWKCGIISCGRLIGSRISSRSRNRNIHIARTINDVRSHIGSMKRGTSIGFVPTMGALHDGHISLIKRARAENDIVAASIFVNPKQFTAGEDLDKYPRTFEVDKEKLEAAKADFIFAPLCSEMYPVDGALCHVEPPAFSNIIEGQLRPEFFRGVATVVCKLFNIVQPTVAYFGQKDISQCILVHRMVKDLNMPVKIVVCGTVRDSDGLAMSSRNTYLSADERKVANVLYRALKEGKDLFTAQSKASSSSGTISRDAIVDAVTKVLKSEPRVSKVEYVSVASHYDMKELQTVSMEKGAVLSSAIRLGNVRLIDNLLLGGAEKDIMG